MHYAIHTHTQKSNTDLHRLCVRALRHVWYRYLHSVSVQAKSIGIDGIGKFWYWSKPIAVAEFLQPFLSNQQLKALTDTEAYKHTQAQTQRETNTRRQTHKQGDNHKENYMHTT